MQVTVSSRVSKAADNNLSPSQKERFKEFVNNFEETNYSLGGLNLSVTFESIEYDNFTRRHSVRLLFTLGDLSAYTRIGLSTEGYPRSVSECVTRIMNYVINNIHGN
jgi:hypothetical protein